MNEALGRLLAVGNVAEVFEYGPRVVKLYKAEAAKPVAFREASTHAAVEALGLPVPKLWGVQTFGDRWGLVFDRVEQPSFAEQMRDDPEHASGYIDSMVRLQIHINSQTAVHLAALNARLAANIAATGLLDGQRKHDLLARLAGMPEGEHLCHGDFHPMNILGTLLQPIVIDWADARRGDPTADVCRSYLLMTLYATELATPYLDAYCETADMAREIVLDWLPYIAAARLAENIPGEADRLLKISRLAPASKRGGLRFQG
jgi:hypothetical protein